MNIILLVLSIILFCLSFISIYFTVAGTGILSIDAFIMGFILRKKYKEMDVYDEKKNYFDATSIDYEEEVYQLKPDKEIRKEKLKSEFKRSSIKFPMYMMFVFGALGIGALLSILISTIK